ncbi:MAG: hypothetical protein GC185_02605 [Alphaproteobacteria bacterium]|nr:hypothetical protein [Alphaproteobacteria bacterium]
MNDERLSRPRAQAQAAVLNASPIEAADPVLHAGLQRVYYILTTGLAVTAMTAWLVAHVDALYNLCFDTPLRFLFIFGFLFIGLFESALKKMPAKMLQAAFYGFCAVMGVTFSYIFEVYTSVSIVNTFICCIALFSAVSLYGHRTKRDLHGMAVFMGMGLTGLFIAWVVSGLGHAAGLIEGRSAVWDFVTAAVGTTCFTGLAAWETQNMRDGYKIEGPHTLEGRHAFLNAFGLYFNFLILSQYLLMLLGQRKG